MKKIYRIMIWIIGLFIVLYFSLILLVDIKVISLEAFKYIQWSIVVIEGAILIICEMEGRKDERK